MFLLAAAAAARYEPVNFQGGPLVDFNVPPGPSVVTLELRANGEEWHDKGGVFSKQGDWLLLGAAADYEVRATVVSGDTPSGNIGVWTAMNVLNDWGFIQSGNGLLNCNLLVEARRVLDNYVVESKTYTLRAEVSN